MAGPCGCECNPTSLRSFIILQLATTTSGTKMRSFSTEDGARVQQLDADMKTMQTTLRSMASERNLLASPSCCIPSEVLARIFVEYKALIIDSMDIGQRPYPMGVTRPRKSEANLPMPWVRPSHVCSHWRSVALETAMLWNILYLNNVNWTKEILRRSRGANLHIKGGFPPNPRDDFGPYVGSGQAIYQRCLLLIFPHFSRVSSFDIRHLPFSSSRRSPGNRPPKLVEAFMKADPSQIRELALAIGPMFPSPPSPGGSNWDFLNDFLQRTVDSAHLTLTSLDLCSCPDRLWINLQYPSLTQLKMLYSPESSSTTALLELLSRLPRLEVFELQQQCTTSITDVRTVHLPHLKSMVLGTSFPSIVYLMRHIVAPPDAKIKLSDTLVGPLTPTASLLHTEIISFADALRPYLLPYYHHTNSDSSASPSSTPTTPIRSMGITVRRRELYLTFSRTSSLSSASMRAGEPFSLMPLRYPSNASLDIMIQSTAQEEDLASALLPRLFPYLEDVESVSITSPPSRTVHGTTISILQNFFQHFRGMEKVRWLDVNLGPVELMRMLESLRPSPTSSLDETLFPSLEKVILCKSDIFNPAIHVNENPLPHLAPLPPPPPPPPPAPPAAPVIQPPIGVQSAPLVSNATPVPAPAFNPPPPPPPMLNHIAVGPPFIVPAWPNNQGIPAPAHVPPQAIIETFTERRDAGHPISAVEFHGPLEKLNAGFLAELREVVSSVRCFSWKRNGEWRELDEGDDSDEDSDGF